MSKRALRGLVSTRVAQGVLQEVVQLFLGVGKIATVTLAQQLLSEFKWIGYKAFVSWLSLVHLLCHSTLRRVRSFFLMIFSS